MLVPMFSSAALAILLFWHGSLSITNSLFILLCRDFIRASINARGNRLGKERSADSVIGLCKYDNSMIRHSYQTMNSPAPGTSFHPIAVHYRPSLPLRQIFPLAWWLLYEDYIYAQMRQHLSRMKRHPSRMNCHAEAKSVWQRIF